MKSLLVVLSLALAALAMPSSSAAPPVDCTPGPISPGGDTHCEATLADCDVLLHVYDTEDALNHYKAGCGGCGYDNYGRPALRLDCHPTPAATAAPDVVQTHCVADEMGVAHCTTTIAGTCAYSSTSGAPSPSLACWHPAVGSCSLSPLQNPPSAEGCGVAVSSMAAEVPPEVCTTGIAQTWCDLTVGPCDVRVTPWTAWGDVWARADCRGGGAGPTCHTEVHTQDPLDPEHWCAW